MVSMLGASAIALGCLRSKPEEGESQSSGAASAAYSVPQLSQAELDAELARACRASLVSHKPVLVEFSAPWCQDCQVLAELKQDASLARVLRGFEVVVVNIGDFDQHPRLLQAFGIKAIAHWEVLRPTLCSAPVETWPRSGGRSVEPTATGSGAGATKLAEWLARLSGQ
jgi:thiol-disulfide isomerase/thioredoxin